MILFFDTETTGLCPGRIIQLSYVMLDESGVKAKNFFFAVEYIEPSAVQVHGFTVEKLAELSRGRTFSMDIDEIYDDFANSDLIIAHNVKFDINFMIAEFNYQERQFRYKESLDTMKVFTPIMKIAKANGNGYKYPRLQEMHEFLDVYSYDISRKTNELFGTLDVCGHDARYDTVALYLSFEEGAKKFENLGETRAKYLHKSDGI